MHVSSNRPGAVTLPFVKDGKKCSYIFQPGRNKIDPADWELIKEQHKSDWHYYGSILTPFKEVEISLPPDAEVGRADGKMAREGEFESFDVKTCLQMIANTTDRDILTSWEHAERNIGKDRKIILEAIQKQIKLSPQEAEDRARQVREHQEIEERFKADRPGA